MKKSLIILVAVAAILMNACAPKDKGDSMTLPIEKYTLANGLDVILHQDHVRSYCVGCYLLPRWLQPRGYGENRLCTPF